MSGSLEAPLARALDEIWDEQYYAQLVGATPLPVEDSAAFILAALRSDPAVTAALAEALHDIGPEPLLGLHDVCNLWPEHERQADAILDALLGPRESAGGMEP